MLLLLLLLPSFWPRPAGTPEETAGSPHRPSPIPSSPTPDHQTPRTPANHKKNNIQTWLKMQVFNHKRFSWHFEPFAAFRWSLPWVLLLWRFLDYDVIYHYIALMPLIRANSLPNGAPVLQLTKNEVRHCYAPEETQVPVHQHTLRQLVPGTKQQQGYLWLACGSVLSLGLTIHRWPTAKCISWNRVGQIRNRKVWFAVWVLVLDPCAQRSCS